MKQKTPGCARRLIRGNTRCKRSTIMRLIVTFLPSPLNKRSSAAFVIGFQDVRDCGESRGREGRTSSGDKEENKPVLIHLTAKISSDRFSCDLMLKQMDHSQCITDKPRPPEVIHSASQSFMISHTEPVLILSLCNTFLITVTFDIQRWRCHS